MVSTRTRHEDVAPESPVEEIQEAALENNGKISTFDFEEATLPKLARVRKSSKYSITLDKFMDSKQNVIRLNLGEVHINTATQGFRNAIARKYPGEVSVHKREDSLYLKKEAK